MKFHYSEKSQQVKPCKATKTCPLGGFHGAEHEVREHIEEAHNKEFQKLPKLTKLRELESHPHPVYENEDEQEFWETVRENIGTFVWNGNEFAVQPKDEKASTTYCIRCNKIISKDNLYFTENKSKSRCDSCGGSLNGMFDTGAVLARSSIKYFDDDTVKATTWFHTTQNPKWKESLTNEDRSFIHMGTEEAAKDRCNTLYNDPDSPTYIYELEIVETAKIHDKVHYEDPYQDNTPSLTSNPDEYSKIGFDGITRYVNEMEDRGSISLLANPKTLRVKNVRIMESNLVTS